MGISLGNLINVNYQHLKRSLELVVMLNGIGLLYSSIKSTHEHFVVYAFRFIFSLRLLCFSTIGCNKVLIMKVERISKYYLPCFQCEVGSHQWQFKLNRRLTVVFTDVQELACLESNSAIKF